jgi:tetratricopeptide (TPR) repeat protein
MNLDVHRPVRLARTVLQAACDGTLVAQYGLVERARPAALPVVPRTRLSVQANYISDLGVRGLDEAALFLDEHLRLQALSPADGDEASPEAWASGWARGTHDERDLCALVDAQVSFAGAWPLAQALVNAVFTSSRVPNSFGTLLIGAVVAGGDPATPLDADELFRLAVDAAPSEVDGMLSELRHAAWTLKRRGDPAGALARLTDLETHARDAERQYRISPADASTLCALAANLEALARLRRRDPEGAQAAIDRATALIPDDGWVAVDRDAGFRYRSQIRTNAAQMLVKRNDLAGALAVMRTNLEEGRRDDPDSVSETLSVTAYFAYLHRDWNQALELLAEAYGAVRLEGSPNRLLQCRKIAVAALHSCDREKEAQHVLDRSREDPLGFDETLL